MKNHLSAQKREHPRSHPKTRQHLESQAEGASQWWYHITDPLPRGRGWNSGRSASSAISQRMPLYFLFLALRKKSLQVQKRRGPVGVKTPRKARLIRSHTNPDNCPRHSTLLPHPRYQERTLSTKMWIGYQRLDKQTKSKQEPYISFLITEPCRENWCFATGSSWRLMYCANHFQLHPLSFLHRTKKNVSAKCLK